MVNYNIIKALEDIRIRMHGTHLENDRIIIDDAIAEIKKAHNESLKGDLISKSDVIELIESKCVNGCLEHDGITLIDAYGLIDDVSDLPTACNDGWIRCAERLPEAEDLHSKPIEECKQYLIQREYGVMEVAHYIRIYGRAHFSAHVLEIKDVIAWQPLPQPYKENENE